MKLGLGDLIPSLTKLRGKRREKKNILKLFYIYNLTTRNWFLDYEREFLTSSGLKELIGYCTLTDLHS